MVEPFNAKNLVKHIANGRLGELCLLCLIPLKENSESVFTLICKEETEYCIADTLKAVCQVELDRSENFNVCIDCFKSASEAYKFHLQAKRSIELIMHYTQELLNNVNNIVVTSADTEKLLFIPLTEYIPTTNVFDFNLEGIGRLVDENNLTDCITDDYGVEDGSIANREDVGNMANYNNLFPTDSIADDYNSDSFNRKAHSNDDFDDTETDDAKNAEENIILVVEKDDSLLDDNADSAPSIHSSDDEDMIMIVNEKKVRKKRDPMTYMSCSQCPIKYRFVSKLKVHMKTVHNIDLFYCKVCKIITEHKEQYEEHLKSHTDKHQCTICNIVYKKADTLVAHMKLHEKNEFEQLENANICEQCGTILEDEASLEEHMKNKHVKRYTCYYCGRMYRGEGSFEGHIRKHEEYWDKKQSSNPDQSSSKQGGKQANKLDKSKRSVCQTCGKDFVDERSLLWHQRLHSNDRPYTCEVCGRGFVSKNRRNQHSLCAHTPPQRRCPLCPALFHLRSMVNTHVKKVHLQAHKRRNRTSKHQNVFWRTQPVPIQELSIDVQHDVLELRAAQHDKMPEPDKTSPSMSLFV